MANATAERLAVRTWQLDPAPLMDHDERQREEGWPSWGDAVAMGGGTVTEVSTSRPAWAHSWLDVIGS
jgi:hypothetical protein